MNYCSVFKCRAVFMTVLWLVAGVSSAGAKLPDYYVASESTFPSVNPGSSVRLIVSSDALGDRLTVDVWFPPTYSASASGGFPVVYAHDGQNLFDPSLSFATVAWELDNTAARLAARGEIQTPIIVGIHNRGAKNLRPNDYFPEKAIQYISETDKSLIWSTCAAGFYGDEYAAFIAAELKPLIDNLYNTNSDRKHTFTMGSSMGGLASLYLLCEYPEVFGGAACLSTHWIGSFKMNPDYSLQPDPVCARALLDYMAACLPDPQGRKLYLDQGTTGWDADYIGYEAEARAIAGNHGYSVDNGTLMTYDAIGAGHNEWFWQQRVDKPLTFLLEKQTGGVAEIETDTSGAGGFYYDLQGRRITGRPERGIYIRDGVKTLVK